jgi:hypothetical protein
MTPRKKSRRSPKRSRTVSKPSPTTPRNSTPPSDARLIADDDDEAIDADAAPAAPGDGLGVDFAEDEDLEAADDDEVPFIEDEDEDDPFPEDDIEGLGPEGADDR